LHCFEIFRGNFAVLETDPDNGFFVISFENVRQQTSQAPELRAHHGSLWLQEDVGDLKHLVILQVILVSLLSGNIHGDYK
jgi:hypothetical protein